MFRIEVKNAFGLFLKKTINEVKTPFPDAESKTVKDTYELFKGDNTNEEVKKNAIDENEGLQGQLSFHVRITQDEQSKEVDLKAFAFHDWEKPSENTDNKKWGMLKIPIISQKSYSVIPEKFLKRKIEFFLSISYLQKKENNAWGKLLLAKDNDGNTVTNWEEEAMFRQAVKESLKLKRQLSVRGIEPDDKPKDQLRVKSIGQDTGRPEDEEEKTQTRRQLPNPNPLIDFSRQEEMTPTNEINDEMKPITRTVSKNPRKGKQRQVHKTQ
jgi:hypothetical protein